MSRKCDKLESDDFRNKMKNEFELICKAFNESKMPGLAWLVMATVCLRFMGGQGEQWGVEEAGRERKEGGKERKRKSIV